MSDKHDASKSTSRRPRFGTKISTLSTPGLSKTPTSKW